MSLNGEKRRYILLMLVTLTSNNKFRTPVMFKRVTSWRCQDELGELHYYIFYIFSTRLRYYLWWSFLSSIIFFLSLSPSFSLGEFCPLRCFVFGGVACLLLLLLLFVIVSSGRRFPSWTYRPNTQKASVVTWSGHVYIYIIYTRTVRMTRTSDKCGFWRSRILRSGRRPNRRTIREFKF